MSTDSKNIIQSSSSKDPQIGDIFGTRQITDIVYDTIKKDHRIGRIYVMKCLRCGAILYTTTPDNIKNSKCINCKDSIEWNGQFFHNRAEMAEKLGVTKSSITTWSKSHDNDFSDYTIEWSKQKKPIPVKYKVGDIVNGREIIEIKGSAITSRCLDCGKIRKTHSQPLEFYGCSCNRAKAFPKIGEVINGRKLIDTDGADGLWECVDCGEIIVARAYVVKRHNCKCKVAHTLAKRQINRTTPSGLRKHDLPKNIHHSLPSKKRNYYSYRATIQARYNGIRKGFYYNNQDLDSCVKVLPILKMLALHYKKTGEHITYGQYLEMGSPKLEI